MTGVHARRRTLPTRRVAAVPGRTRATVSVVVPCYNYAEYLPAAVDSALSQDGVDVAVIVVDDASTDDSARVARALAERDGRVTVLENETNRGPVATFNRGLAVAEGEYLVRLDADDLLTPGSLARAVAVLQALPEVGLVYGHPLHFSGRRLPDARSEVTGWYVWQGRDWVRASCSMGANFLTSPEAVMRRAVVDRVGGQRDLAHTHDMEMWLRIACHADVAYIRGADQAWHREHARSLSTTAQDPLVILHEVRGAFDALFEDDGHVEGAAELRAVARRALAEEALDQVQRALDRGTVTPHDQALRNFAAECDPTVRMRARWRRQGRAIERLGRARALTRARGVLGRARRRLGMAMLRGRWHRTGVYVALATAPRGGSR